MTGVVAVALLRVEDGKMLTGRELGEEAGKKNVEFATLGEIIVLELLIKTPLPGVLEFAVADEKTMLRGTLKDEAELNVVVDHAPEMDEAFEGKIVFGKDVTAVAFKFVDELLDEIGDADVKSVLFQKL